MSKSKDLGGGYSHLREEREYDPETSTLRRRLALDKKPGAKEHLKRNAGAYAGAAAGLAGGRFTASKLSSMLKGKKMAGKTLEGLSREGKMYAGGVVAGAGLNLGGQIDKGRANARIYEKLVKEGKIDAFKISKESEDPRSGLPKAVVDYDRDLFKRRDQRDALKRLEAKLDGVLNEFGVSTGQRFVNKARTKVRRFKQSMAIRGRDLDDRLIEANRNATRREAKMLRRIGPSFEPSKIRQKTEAMLRKGLDPLGVGGHRPLLASGATGAAVGGVALKLAKKKEENNKARAEVKQFSEFSDRTRNGDGQFVGGATGGADPVTMRQAYGEKPKKKNPLLAAGAGAAALAGAGLLGGTVKGRAMVAGGLRKVEGLARTGRDKLQGRVRMSKPGRGLHREARPGFGEVMQQTQTGLSESMRKRMRS